MRRLLVLVCALALAGCRIDTTVGIDVRPDGSGTVRVEVVADAELVAREPGLGGDLRLDDLRAAGWTVDGPAATATGGLRLALAHPFADVTQANALLASLAGGGGPLRDLHLGRDVDGRTTTVHLDGTMALGTDLSGFVDATALQALGAGPYADALGAGGLRAGDVTGLTVQASLPGSTRSNGGGGDPTWTAAADGTATTITATAVQRYGRGAWGAVADIVLILLVVWIVLAVGVGASVVVARRRR
jgi:hypothetical protein